jgi:aldehyde dehydrogenase (NAD+)
MISDDPSQIKAVFDRSKAAFASGKTLDLDFREAQLKNLLKGCNEMLETFGESMKKDLGHRDIYAFLFVGGILPEIEFALKNFRQWAQRREVQTPALVQPAKSYLVPEPFGSVLIMGPWNYPYLCTIPYVATAIAAGNTVVLKPSELSPNSSNAMVQLFEKYLDKDCYQVIEGQFKVASEITTYPWDFIVFTGGTEKGKKVAQAAAANLVPYILELGGKCPVFVNKDADLDNAALRIIATRLLNWGQTCISPEYVLAHKDIKETLTQKLKEQMIKLFGEDPKKSPDHTKIVNEFHLKRLEKILNEHGGKVHYVGGDGKVDHAEKYCPPAIIEDPLPTSTLATEETFGPFLYLIAVADVKEASKYICDRPKPLAAYYFGDVKSEDKAYFLKYTSSGAVTVNDCCMHANHEGLPFGGVGASGTGQVRGLFGFNQLSHTKPVLDRSTSNAYPGSIRFPPYAETAVQELLDALGGNPQKKE